MVLNKLMGFLGMKDSSQDNTAKPSAESSQDSKAIKDVEHFVDYVIRILVDNPDAVRTAIEKNDEGLNIIRIYCHKDDMGKIIGKNGKTITAIRTLASNAGTRSGMRLTVELAE